MCVRGECLHFNIDKKKKTCAPLHSHQVPGKKRQIQFSKVIFKVIL